MLKEKDKIIIIHVTDIYMLQSLLIYYKINIFVSIIF